MKNRSFEFYPSITGETSLCIQELQDEAHHHKHAGIY